MGSPDETAATLGTADELESLVSERGAWRCSYELDHQLRAWGERYVAAGRGAADERRDLAEGARRLLLETTEQLLQSDWLGWLAAPAQALEEVEGQSATYCAVELTMTVAPDGQQHAAARGGAEGVWGSVGGAPFPQLRGAELYEVESRLRSALHAALAALAGDRGSVKAEVVAAPDLSGFVRVQLSCLRSAQAWSDMVDLAVGLVQGALEGLPPSLLVVNMRAGRASGAAICRRCCLGQVEATLS